MNYAQRKVEIAARLFVASLFLPWLMLFGCLACKGHTINPVMNTIRVLVAATPVLSVIFCIWGMVLKGKIEQTECSKRMFKYVAMWGLCMGLFITCVIASGNSEEEVIDKIAKTEKAIKESKDKSKVVGLKMELAALQKQKAVNDKANAEWEAQQIREAIADREKANKSKSESVGWGDEPSSWPVEQYLKQTAHNPRSIRAERVTRACKTGSGWIIVCDCEGTNAFGATITRRGTFRIQHLRVVEAVWN